MSDVTPIDKDQTVVDLFGRLHVNIWQANAGADLVRDLATNALQHPDDQHEMEKLKLACNGLLAATSYMMSDLDTLQELLEVATPNWNEIDANLPDGMDIREAIERGAS